MAILGSGIAARNKRQRIIWMEHRPRTYLELTAPTMSKMFMVPGPHLSFSNATRSTEQAVQVVT